MASSKSKTAGTNGGSPHGGAADKDKWKTSPSTETTSDEGENAKIGRERKIEENAPNLGKPRR
jgi:hypothetical protein